jgi:SAM-dependent methyltransferase
MTSIEASYYENKEFWSGELFDEADRRRFDFVISNISPQVTSLLDVGCGNGLFLQRVRAMRPDITVLHGVDRSGAALARVSVPTTQASADSLPLPDRSFDCVTCLEVVEHLPNAVYERALGELARMSRHQLLLSVPHEQDLTVGRVECPACRTLFNPDYHLRSYSRRSLPALFDSRGYKMRDAMAFGVSREYALVRQIDALKRSRENRFPVDVPCPVCGEVLPAKEGGIQAHAAPAPAEGGRKGARQMIKSLWPKVDVPRWLLADYRRIEPA